MLAILPDFTPRDSHSLWYTSSRSTSQPHGLHDAHHGDSASHSHAPGQTRSRGHIIERTALARLAADEQYMHRRRISVQNFGSSWLRPLGVPKTLHQMREEKREQEEHQEALRREQLAQELREAEGGGMPEEGAMAMAMDDVQLDGAQDLDDDIPDADADDPFTMGPESDEEEVDDEEEEVEPEGESELDEEALREERQNDLMAARMRMTDDAFREALVRGDPDRNDMYGGEEELEEEHRGHMLDEEDFAHDDMENGLDMDADLDDDVPEAESGLYEHTDSEAELSSSEEERDEDDNDEDDEDEQYIGFAPRTADLAPPLSPTLRSRRASGPRESMDLSNILSQDESSFMESSPAQRRGR